MKMSQRRIFFIAFGFFALSFAGPVFAETTDLDQDGTPDHEDEDVVVFTNQSLSAGEYYFRNLTVASNTVLTLVGDPGAPGDFKGVKIIADSITVENGSAISANGTGYTSLEDSPGAGESDGGYGYGGKGGDWHYKTSSALGGATYGSAFLPTDLGSGGSINAGGGGALWLVVSGTFKNDGSISANGIKDRASGGSIYVRTSLLEGSGMFTANGARCYGFFPYSGAGGGGRIAVYYEESGFVGSVEASRGGIGTNSTCNGERSGQDGTIVFVDTTNNDLYLYDRLLFQASDSPYTFNQIVLSEGASVSSEPGVSIIASEVTLDEGSSLDTGGVHSFTTDNLLIDDGSVFTSAEGQSLAISSLAVRNRGVAQLGRGETLSAFDTVTLEDESQITAAPMHILYLDARDVTIDTTSAISVTGAGHPPKQGPGYNDSGAGASHGGLGERGTPSPVYGSETEPVDFGSGGSPDAYGGGSLRMIVSGTLENNGNISADATPQKNGASGGSIYVTTNTLSGSGSFTALGGNTRGYTTDVGAGGGGRIAMYYRESDFTGTTSAKGGDRYVGGAIQQWYYAQDGTVVFSEKETEASIDPLLLQYLPILRMHPDEDYFPMNVEAFVGASALWDDAGILPDELLEAYNSENPLTLESLASYEDSENLYLAFSDPESSKSINVGAGKEKYENLVASDTAKATVYAHRMNDSYEDSFGREREFIVLQYWYFYAMNDWKEKDGRNNHEGDWESVFVFLDEDEEPKYVAFSAHHNDGAAEKWNLSQYGSVRREWSENEIDVDGSKVKSYVALGSHANYPEAGVFQAGLSFRNDVTSEEGEELGAESFIQKVEISPDLLWFVYEGKWGSDQMVVGEDGPQGPSFIEVSGHKRFHDPIEWAGIDAIDEVTTEEPATNFTFQGSGLYMDFASTTIPGGTTFRIAPYREPITFGAAPQSTTLLPTSWEIDSSLTDNLFNAHVHFPIDQDFKSLQGDLNVYLFDPLSHAWEKQTSYIEESGDFIVLETTHFSRYALGVEEVEEVSVPVITTSSGSSGSRIPKVSETELAEAFITQEIISSEEQINLLAQKVLILTLEYMLDTYNEKGSLSTYEIDFVNELLRSLSVLISIRKY